MKILTLGNCCKKSQQNHQNTLDAVKNLGLADVSVENTGDWSVIGKYGVMSTPAIVVDDKVICSGKLLPTEQIEKLILERLGK